MGMFNIASRLFGRRIRTGNSVVDALLPMLMRRGGLDAIGGLLGKFTGAGFGNKANSWVGTGENIPLDPDEVEVALGADEVHRLATEAGVSDEEAKADLADAIPNLVDQLSPDGTLPTGSATRVVRRLDFDAIVER